MQLSCMYTANYMCRTGNKTKALMHGQAGVRKCSGCTHVDIFATAVNMVNKPTYIRENQASCHAGSCLVG